VTSPEDPEQRIADLEKQVADARRIADLERQLAEARSETSATSAQFLPPGVHLSMQPDLGGFDLGRPVAPPPDSRLSEPPRRVPISFILAELLPFRWWYLFAMFMVAIPAIIVWITNPELAAPVAVAVLVAIYAFQLWTARKRLALLKWGRVATVVGSDVTSRATYYSGTTWSNVWLPQAHGWHVTRELWSGRNVKTMLRYSLDSYQGELKISGRSYDDGVVLADSRHPERALCVSSFAYDLDRDDAGDWIGHLRTRLTIGMVAWFLIMVVWLVLATAISTGTLGRTVAELSATRIPQGGTAKLSDMRATDTVYCNDGHLTVGGSTTTYTIHGHCASLDVSGIDNVITVDSVDTISLSGIGNHVTYRSGQPKMTGSGGINNVAVLAP
jgi:Protein of unknown function (DUF3060)